MPLKLSIASGDYLLTSFSNPASTAGYELISNVGAATLANGAYTYAVTVPSGVYTCQVANTTISGVNAAGARRYVLGA